MGQKRIVTVDCSKTSGVLDTVELAPGDWVEWVFVNIVGYQESIPWIQFENALGPFQCLQEAMRGVIHGKGNVGADVPTSYSYQAQMLDGAGDPNRLKITGRIVNRPQDPNTSPTVVVDVHMETKTPQTKTPQTKTLSTVPKTLALSIGDTAIWHVRNIPAKHSVTFRFDDIMPFGPNRMSALFASLLTSRDTDPDALRVYGTGFAPPDPKHPGPYQYYIDVRDSQGRIVATDDPTIDNLGQPGPPGDGDPGRRGKGGCFSSLITLVLGAAFLALWLLG